MASADEVLVGLHALEAKSLNLPNQFREKVQQVPLQRSPKRFAYATTEQGASVSAGSMHPPTKLKPIAAFTDLVDCSR